MKTITCASNRVNVTEVAQLSGVLDAQNQYEESLYRDRAGQYYLEETRVQTLRPRTAFKLPLDAARRERHQVRHTRIKPVSDKTAMMWFIERTVGDDALRQMFIWMIVSPQREPSNIVTFPKPALELVQGGAR